MPPEQPLRRQRLAVALCRVEHHLDDALDMAVGRLQPADVDAKLARDRRADLIGIQPVALDLAALDHVVGESAEDGFLPQPETERFHLADEPALQVPSGGEGRGQPGVVPSEIGPIRKLMDIFDHLPRILR